MANVKKWNAVTVQQNGVPNVNLDQQRVAEYSQQQENKKNATTQFNQPWVLWYTPWLQTWVNLPQYNPNVKNPNDAYQVETISSWGWNNYYFPNGQLTTQGQQNALNGSWHVAWLPQWPQTWLIEDYSQMQSVGMYVPEQTDTPTAQPTTPKWNWGTKQPSVSTPQNEVSEQPASDIENWQIPDSWKKQEEEKPANNTNEQALADMQADLGWDNTWMLYGKVTADETGYGNGIQTVADPYNVEKATNEARIANLRKLQTMSSEDIATSITWWYTPYGDQAMRDLMQYNPEKYAEVQQFIKQQKWQNSINSITTGDVSGMNTTQTSIDNVNNWVDSWADGLSSSPQQAWQLVTNISSSMSNNWVATTATQEMLNLNAQMADIQEKMANVKKEAQKAFKWDVPQYIVDAYANNRLQEYQSQYNKLESRYNAAMDLYKTELDNAKRKEEMNLKYLQYQQWVSESNWKQYYQSMQLKQDSIKRVNGKAYQMNFDWTMTQISDTTAYTTYQKNTSQLLQWYIAQYTNGWATKTANGYKYNISWWQCETFTDNFTEAATWLRMTWANGRGRTTAEEKIWYINSFTPEVWSIAVAVWWAYDSTYWHTMLVTWYDPTTQTVDLLWSNNNWDEMVYSSSMSLSQLMNSWVKGFRNPYYDMAAQSAAQWWTWTYSYYAWPMQSFFEEAYENATVASERADIKAAQDSYAIMNELVETWTIDKIANSDEFNVLLSEISNGKFVDSNWNINFDKITKYVRNKLKDEDIAYWMDRLRRLIEKKLRKESWAAISMSEWNSNFDMYLPNVWQSPAYRYKRLQALERDIVAEQLPPKYRANYIPVIWSSTVREIR